MISDRYFAPDYDRQEGTGWILFPDSDVSGGLRSKLFTERVEHPAKNNLYMMESIFQYCIGDLEGEAMALDPMAGGGSSMIGAKYCKQLLLIELEVYFQMKIKVNMQEFGDNIVLLDGNCLNFLPMFKEKLDLITFSPPYSNQIKQNSGMPQYDPDQSGSANSIINYTTSADNLSNKNDFVFNVEMGKVYQGCYGALKQGGWMVIIIKDQIRGGKRVDFGTQHVRIASRVGFQVAEWHRHNHLGKLFGVWNKSKGHRVVEDEHIILFRK